MKSDLQVFKNDEFGNVRVVEIDNEPWFAGKDVATILGYTNPQKAIRDHVDSEDKTVNESFIVNGTKGTLINESGLYSLVISSKLPSAKKFKHWVTSDILPSIRKHGAYVTPQTMDEMIANPDFTIKLLTALKEERERTKELETKNQDLMVENNIQAQQIAEMNPKVTYYDEVLSCVDAVPITLIAKDYGWTAQQMNNFLYENKIQYPMSGTWVLYKEHSDMGYTKTETFWYRGHGGKNYSQIQTKWTQKGRLFIYELMKNNGHLPLIEQD